MNAMIRSCRGGGRRQGEPDGSMSEEVGSAKKIHNNNEKKNTYCIIIFEDAWNCRSSYTGEEERKQLSKEINCLRKCLKCLEIRIKNNVNKKGKFWFV